MRIDEDRQTEAAGCVGLIVLASAAMLVCALLFVCALIGF
jgi:hypothetical protein